MLRKNYINLTFLLSMLCMLFFAASAPQITYAEYGEGSWCNAGGHVGTCWSRDRVSCGTYYDSGNYCPGDNSVQCCVNSQVSCRSGTGQCHNDSSGGFGNTYSCNGTWYTGYCPGPYDVRCCVPNPPPPPPTNVKATCAATGRSVTVTWTRPSGYSYSYARIHDATTNKECSYSGVITGSSFTCSTAVPGHRYSYWVHTTTSSGNPYSSEVPTAYTTTVLCPAPTATPTPTRTPTPTPTRTPTPTPTRFNQSTTTPGIIFTGNGTSSFGQGQASVRNWIVGGLTYPEIFATATTTSTTSYQYLFNKASSSQVTINNMTSLSGCSSLANCTLPANLPRGVYRANGNLILNAYNFPANRNYVILVNGDLTLRGNIGIPNNSTVLFSANRDIIVPSTVGSTTNSFPLPDAQIQGLFSANRNFVIQGINNCITGADRMLNLEGAIVVNAGGAGGSLINQRDLCGANPTIPSFTIRGRIDFLFNLPEFVMQQRTTFRETAP